MNLLDAAVIAWFACTVALLVVQQLPSPRVRTVRVVLIPVCVLLGAAFAWKVATVFAPMLGYRLG